MASGPTLVADIGGTNARFALVGSDGRLGRDVSIATSDFDDITMALDRGVLPALGEQPRAAVLALAAPIEGDQATLTNGQWTIEPKQLMAAFDLEEIALLNDFEALALSVPFLDDDMLMSIGGGLAQPDAPKLIIGPGTGLGVAALVPVEGRWLPIATEGGHTDFGPVDRRDFEIWPNLFGADGRISAEMLLSGPGIERLYVGVTRTNGGMANPLPAPEIVNRAVAGTDADAVETIELFCSYLGRFAGSMSLLFLARGGVYIGGGIAPRIAEQLQTGRFRQTFEDKHPFNALVGSIATSLIIEPEPALLGLARFVADPSRFIVDLTKRTWRKIGGAIPRRWSARPEAVRRAVRQCP
jgi:glucokinase